MCKKLKKLIEKKMKHLEWYDISLIKLSVAAFVLMLVSVWPVLASANWYWYGLIFVIAMILPLKHWFK